ncbi:MAG: SCP2 sterol-binding domain-containing protein [Promethearchaeota archaeon]
MSIINQPEDILGLAIKNLIEPLYSENKTRKKLLKIKNRIIILELEGIYAISMIFDKKSNLKIEYGEKTKYSSKIKTNLDAFVGIAEGKVGIISAFLRRKIKVKKIFRIFTLFRFYRVLFPAIKKANENPIIKDVLNVLY